MKFNKRNYWNGKYGTFIILLALEIVLAFSSLGYIVIPPISVTSVHIPVLLCAMLFGPVEGAVSGLVFGLTSMWKASVTATAYSDIIFSPFLSGSPIKSILLSIGARMVFGVVAGGLFSLAKRVRRPRTGAVMLTAVVSSVIHSMLVYGAMQVFFPPSGAKVWDVFQNFVVPQKLLTYLLTASVVGGVYQIQTNPKIRASFQNLNTSKKGAFSITALVLLILFVMNELLTHFCGRLHTLFQRDGLVLSEKAFWMMSQLRLQLLAGLFALVIIFIIIYTIMKASLDRAIIASEQDLMTGLYNRTAVIRQAEIQLQIDGGYLAIIDIDHFKKINDTYGHPMGDKVLIEVARLLRDVFSSENIVGRLGGDEFCVFIKIHMSVDEVEKLLDGLHDVIHQAGEAFAISAGLSCSIGVTKAVCGDEFAKLYKRADYALYAAKRAHNSSCVFFEKEDSEQGL